MNTATLPEVLKVSVQRALSEMHTCLPGKIESFDHKTQKASVLPLIKKKYRDGKAESMPVIQNVPVVFPRCSKGSFTFPLEAGDGVLLVFSERSMERFLAQGGEQEPGDTRKFDLTDAIAIPGLFPFSVESKTENNEDSLWIFNETKIRLKEDGNIEIETPADLIVKVEGDCTAEIGGDATIEIGGDATLEIGGNTTANIGGDATLEVGGTTNLNSGGDVNITAPTINITGTVNIDGEVNTTSTITAQGDVTGSGISLASHTHGGVQSGGSNTSGPQ